MKTVKALLARDLDGSLCIYFNGKLRKHVDMGIWNFDLVKSKGIASFASLNKDSFPEVKWEDEEPTEVSIEIVGKKSQQPQEQH